MKIYEGKSINKREWENYDEEELEYFIESIYRYYRETGFPYFPTDEYTRHKEYQKLKNYNFSKIYRKGVIGQSMHGLSLSWSYMPHSWSIQCNKMKTVKEVFEDDEIFRKVIRKRIKFGDNISDNGIRKMLKMYSGVQSVSNFRPTAAAYIYHHFGGGVVWDMSSGFGGRLLGSSLVKMYYIGSDPSIKSYKGLKEMQKDFNIEGELYCIGSEDFNVDMESLDLCFTSPPYYDTEKYSEEESQSYIRYPSKEEWIWGYLYKTYQNCYRGLKRGRRMIINIANVKSFTDIEEKSILVAKECGFKLEDEWKLSLSRHKGGYKYEPIFIFKK